MDELTESRISGIYNILVDETENPETYQNRDKNKALAILLATTEYIMEGGENPLLDFFDL